jgi:hypothetical protein
MLHPTRLTLIALALLASGCAATGGWMGATDEKAYDAALDARRLAEVLNNDDYYEMHRDGRIYVISDVKDYKVFLATGEMPLAVTKFGAGPHGETVKMSLTKNETKAMEKLAGYRGGAQRMYEGETKGIAKGFYGQVQDADKIYVFGDWGSLESYRKSGEASGASTPGAGPNGETVIIVGAADPAEMMTKFKAVYAK